MALLAGAVLLLAGLVRLLASRQDLWLDEIWSLGLVQQLSSPLAVFAVRDANSHPVNSIFLYLLREQEDPVLLRLPVVLAGVASVALAGLVARRRGLPHAVAAMVLVGGSYLMILYGSEARGYGFAACFTLAVLYQLKRLEVSATWTGVVVLAGLVCLAVLSHLSFLIPYAALLLWSGVSIARRQHSAIAAARRFLMIHALPAGVLLAILITYGSRLEVSGAPPVVVSEVAIATASLSVGLPGSGGLEWLGAALAGAVVLAGSVVLVRRGCDSVVLYAAALILMPGLLLLSGPPYLSPRYFLGSVALFLVFCGELLGDVYDAGRHGRWLSLACLVAFVVANAVPTAALLRYGRGQYSQALLFMASRTPGPTVDLASDSDFQSQMVFGYHARSLPPNKNLTYHSFADRPAGGAGWFVLHPEGGAPSARFLRGPDGTRYRWERRYHSASLSGMPFDLYRNLGQGGGPPDP